MQATSDDPPPLKLLLLLEKHAKADYGSVDEQAAEDGHDHGFDADNVGVGEDDGKGWEPALASEHMHTVQAGRFRNLKGERGVVEREGQSAYPFP